MRISSTSCCCDIACGTGRVLCRGTAAGGVTMTGAGRLTLIGAMLLGTCTRAAVYETAAHNTATRNAAPLIGGEERYAFIARTLKQHPGCPSNSSYQGCENI